MIMKMILIIKNSNNNDNNDNDNDNNNHSDSDCINFKTCIPGCLLTLLNIIIQQRHQSSTIL